MRIPDIAATAGSGNTELTDRAGLRAPAWRAQVDPQLHWAFLFVPSMDSVLKIGEPANGMFRERNRFGNGENTKLKGLPLGCAHYLNPQTGLT